MASRRLSGVVAAALCGATAFFAAERAGYIARPRPRFEAPSTYVSERLQLQEVKNLFRAKQWFEARASLLQLRGAAPEFEPEIVEQYFAACEREIDAVVAVKRAHALLEEGSLVELSEVIGSIPGDTDAGAEERAKLTEAFEAAVNALAAEATRLVEHLGDRDKMVQLQQSAATLNALGRYPQLARLYDQAARRSIERIDHPWREAEGDFARGDYADALKAARACAKADDRCSELAAKLAVIVPKVARLGALTTPKLLELREQCEALDLEEDSVAEKAIAQLVAARAERAAKACLKASDWACVDKQIAQVNDVGLGVSDAALVEAFDEYVDDELTRAERVSTTNSKIARAMVRRLLSFKSIEESQREDAQQLEEDLAGD